MSEHLIPRDPRRTVAVLAMALWSLSLLGGCERRMPQPEVATPGSTNTSPAPMPAPMPAPTPAPLPSSTDTLPSPLPAASAASR